MVEQAHLVVSGVTGGSGVSAAGAVEVALRPGLAPVPCLTAALETVLRPGTVIRLRVLLMGGGLRGLTGRPAQPPVDLVSRREQGLVLTHLHQGVVLTAVALLQMSGTVLVPTVKSMVAGLLGLDGGHAL